MRLFLVLLMLIGVSMECYSQKCGYREIQIGANLLDIDHLHKYNFLQFKDDTQSYICTGNAFTICNHKIDNIRIKTDSKYIIKRVTVRTIDTLFSNYNDWWEDFKYTTSAILNSVNQGATWNNIGNEKNGYKMIVWSFQEYRVAFRVSTKDVSSFDKNFVRYYQFIWQPEGEPPQMW